MSYRAILFFAVLSAPYIAPGQSSGEDTIHLKEVVITESRSVAPAGFKSMPVDSHILAEQKFSSLGEVLAAHSPVFVKSYGQGSLATASFRGTGARHTNINWNGISLNAPALGLANLSDIPVSFADEVNISYGAGGLIYGNGGLGGSIQLDNAPEWNVFKIQASQKIGSFSNYGSQLKLNYGSKKWLGVSRAFYSNAKNNFPFINITKENDPVERQRNAETEQLHLLQELYYKLNPRHSISGRIWLLSNKKNIPPALTNPESHAKINYDALRTMLEWKTSFKRGILNIRSALLKDDNHYTDTVSAINSRHKTLNFINQVRCSMALHEKISFKSGLDYNLEQALSDGHKDAEPVKRHVSSAFTDFTIDELAGAIFNIHLRQTLIDREFSPFLFAVGMEYPFKTMKHLAAKGNFSRNFKAPTLHDLHWYPGGNPGLKPEEGWTAETGLAYEKQIKKLFVKAEVTAFYSKINNRIQWAPTESGYWQAQNVQKVLSRGVESALKSACRIKGFNITGNLIYSYTRATDETTFTGASQGKQLIYVPPHNFNAYLRISKKDWYFTLGHIYTGIRYITTDNTWFMPAHDHSNAGIGKHFTLNKVQMDFSFEVKNYLDRQYQAIANYPMPGRHYSLSADFIFKKNADK